ncbi:serine hydrolase domain-containing protein [Chryseobacterium lathyri]|uniref:serine hydrolase domain-containing protein n=1 Tax=Chryseobacterium lathyri TaxID=395933 RepID=UPI002787FBD9|nr:serine hydrolase domain-containing protein [Chryseobacterium lathyri]MDQ0065172.1 CubicO group peptidase (beta-lactamase class C family) [Chryseobacterium lathyri]
MRNFLFLLFTVLSPTYISSQNNLFAKENSNTKKKLERFLKQNDIPGMSVSISYEGNIILSEGFGYSDIDNKIKVDPSLTKFRIASISKIITALTLMKLNELDSINIDNKPSFYLDSISREKYNFTIRQLSGHLSGLKRNPSGERWDQYNDYTEQKFYNSLKKDDLDFEPGTQFQYSNYGYKLLGLLIEKRCGKTIIQCQEEYIINKIGMTNTIPDYNLNKPEIANFYVNKGGTIQKSPYMDCKFKYAQGCHLSTSEDLIKLGNVFFKPDLIFNSYRPVQIMAKQQVLSSGSKTGYGIGIMSNVDFYNNSFLGHNGLENGARAILRIYPKYNLIISILINSQEPNLEDLTTEVIYSYIERLKKMHN